MNKLNELIIKIKKRWLIGRKISLSIVILILIFIAIIAVQILGLQKLNNTIQTNNIKFTNAVHVKEAEKTFSLFQISLTERQQEGSDYISKLDGIFEGYKISIFKEIEIVEKNTDNDEIKRSIDNLKKTFPEYFQLSKKYILLSEEKNTREAGKLDLEKKMLGNSIYDDLTNINFILSTEQTENAKKAESTVVIILWIAVISATAGTVIGGASAFLLTFHINKGIKNLLKNTSESINYIMDGDFTSRIDPDKISLPDFTSILKQINNLVDAFTLPMTTAAGHIAVIAKGAIPPLMSGDFKGDFRNLANNVNSLTNAMIKINEIAENIARGNLNINIEPRSEEDIILKAMQLSINNLSEFAVSVQTASGQVATGSQEMSEGAQRMALSSSQQAASIEEISSSIEEINSSIAQNAGNASETAIISEKTASDAEKGGDAVKNTVQAMKSIAENISVIEVIADQTNMLALNAAIEAARAGESGKGFAVVANAIRSLAGRSSDAAKQISELTGSSLKVADEAGQLIERIVPEIKRTSGLIQEINSSNLEQAKGIDQISKAVEHLENEIQQNASSTEEMAATSEQLSSQADRLKEIALFFNIKDDIQSNSPIENI